MTPTTNTVSTLCAIRYSTPDNSWISVYITPEIAKKHATDNMRIHHAEASEEELEEYEVTIADTFCQVDGIAECSDWSAEIEYGVDVITD